jgi:hypothetical protein
MESTCSRAIIQKEGKLNFKTCLAATMFLVLSGCSRSSLWHEGSLDSALALAGKEDKLLMIDFGAPG